MKVLLVEDDIPLNTTISNYLSFNNFDVDPIFDGDKALDSIDEVNYDLFIIDINIPNVDGLELVKYIRQKDLITPIIIITASLELENFKTAFENGCNEYIKKPFYLEELEIRINHLIEKNKEDSRIDISDSLTYDMEYEELRYDNELIALRKKERRLLTILLQNLNYTVTTQAIENYVWENDIREKYPLRQLLSDLRKKLSTEKEFIFTDRGLGYKFEIKK